MGLISCAVVDSARAGDAAPTAQNVAAQNFQLGDIAVSGFAGTRLQREGLPPGVDPVTKTIIDPDGVTLRVFGGQALGANSAGQFVDLPVNFTAKAGDVGHVFALAFDNSTSGAAGPTLYAAATSAFGMQILGPDKDGDGAPDRIQRGAPGATFMPGQFGSLPSAGPGTIYKVAPESGSTTVFANVANGGTANGGPGLGGLAIDSASRTLYISDLDTGLIHALSLAADAGTERDVFDYGVKGRPAGSKPAVADDGRRADITSQDFDTTKPSTWGFTPTERRVDALAVHNGRLYFAVAEGPQIWSIAISQAGNFDGEARLETAVQIQEPFPVTSIVFDTAGHMLVAQRGTLEAPQDYSRFVKSGASQVLRFSAEEPDDPATPALWKAEPQEYAVSPGEGYRFASGGLALQYTYAADGAAEMSSCGGSLVISADSLGPERAAHGLQINSAELVRPANMPPTQSVFVNWDARQDDAAASGLAGGVAVLQDCGAGGAAPPVVADEGGPPIAEDGAPPIADSGGSGAPPPIEAGDTATQADGGGETFPPTEDGGGGTTSQGGLTLTKTATVASCSPNGGCSFQISVKNDGTAPVAGPIVVDDTLSAGAAQLAKAAIIGAPAPPWTCSSAPLKFTCTLPGPLEPGEVAPPLDLTFAPGDVGEEKTLENCAVLGPGAGPGQQPAPALPPPPPGISDKNGLKVETTGVSGQCSPTTGNCEFEVKITNTGQAPITAPLKVFNTLSVGSQTQAKNEIQDRKLPGGLTCGPQGNEVVCSQDPLTLAAGASTSFRLTLKVDTTEGGAASFVGNQAVVAFGPLDGTATAAIPFDQPVVVDGDDVDPVDQAQAGDAPAPPICATIPLTPPAQTGPIITTKKGPATCSAKGPCAFTVSVTNSTDAEIKGPIVITDTIDAPQAALSGEPNAPWTCTKTAPVTTCTHPGPLAAKQSVDLNLSFTPNALPGTKRLKNCAVPKQPAAADPVDPAGQNQFAPGKRTEERFQLPTRDASLVDLASFRPRSSVSHDGLLWRIGGAGGNIGGVSNNCRKFTSPPAFSVKQSDGTAITLDKATATPGGNMLGGASIFDTKSGAFDGTVVGNDVKFTIIWQDGKRSVFTGSIDQNGKLSGLARQPNGTMQRFNGLQPWPCLEDDLCFNYGADAVAAATEFDALNCGKVGPGFWSTNQQEHTKWCMAQSRGGDSPMAGQTEARKTQLDKCRSLDAECTKVGLDLASKNDEMKALGCKDALPSLQPDAAKGLCRAMPIEKNALGPAIQAKLNACKTRLAANNGVDPGPVAANDAGAVEGNGDVGQPEPAPEQCVVVPIEDDAGQPDVPPPPQEAAGPSLKLTKTSDPCVRNDVKGRFDCNFVITITNTGTAPFKGPITIEDTMPGVDGLTVGVTTVPPWSCPSVGAVEDGVRACNNRDLSLEPQASTTLPLTVTVPTDMKGLLCQVENSAVITDPPAGPVNASKDAVKASAAVPGAAPDPNTPGKCALPIVVGPAPKLLVPNLAVRKRVLTRGPFGPELKCGIAGKCAFSIEVRNNGNGTFEGPIDLHDNVQEQPPSLMEMMPAANSGWTCTGITNNTSLSCRHAPTKLAPGEAKSMIVLVTPGRSWKKNDTLTNCAELAFRLGQGPLANGNDPGTITGDDKDCDSIVLDPFNVKMSKTGDQICELGGECRFSLSLFNPGPIDHNDPVTITDKLAGLSSAEIVSISPPLPCATQPTSVPFSCTSPGKVSLPLGGPPKVFNLVLRLPNDATAKQFTNCATIGAARSDIGSEQSCVTVATKAAAPPVDVVAPAQCFGGMVLAANGKCECPPGSMWNRRSCVQQRVTTPNDGSGGATPVKRNVCEGARPVGIYPDCCPRATEFRDGACRPRDDGGGGADAIIIDQQRRSVCEGARPVGSYPNCCPRGTQFRRGACRPDPVVDDQQQRRVCEGARPVGNYPDCCPRGTQFRRGACRPDPVTSDPQKRRVCEGARPVGNYPDCCPLGTQLRRGACRPDPVINDPQKRRVCEGARPVGNYPNCCPRGTEYRRGACRPPDGGTDGRQDIPFKICLDGRKVYGKYAQCPPDRSKPKTCPPGTRYIQRWKRCVAIGQPPPTTPQKRSCSGGKVARAGDGACVCPAGTSDRGGRCVDQVR